MIGHVDQQMTSGVTRYFPISGGHASGTSLDTLAVRDVPWIAGTFSSFQAMTHTDATNDIGDGATIQFTVIKNGSATALTCTITATNGQPPYDRFCSPNPDTDTLVVADSDLIQMRTVTTGTLRAGTLGNWAVKFTPTVSNSFVVASGFEWNAAPSSGQHGRGMGWFKLASVAENTTRWVAPVAGTFTKLYVHQEADQTQSQMVVGLNKNGDQSGMYCAFTSGRTCTSTTPITVAVGDSFSFSMFTAQANASCTAGTGQGPLVGAVAIPWTCCTGAGTGTCTAGGAGLPASGDTGVSLVFVPTTSGRYFFANAGNITWNNAGTTYQATHGSRTADGTVIGINTFFYNSLIASGIPLLSFKTMYIKISTLPSGAQTWTTDLWEQNQVDTGTPSGTSKASCLIDSSCGAAPCSCTADISAVTPASDSKGPAHYEFRIIPTNTPTAPNAQVAISVQSLTSGTPPTTIEAAFTASKVQGTTCVAPCVVHLDATATTDSDTALDFHDLNYAWDCGDATIGTWTTTGNDRNTPHSPISACSYEAAGTYTIGLTVRNSAGATDTATTNVTVVDPLVQFGTSALWCFSNNTDFTGCPLDTNLDGACSGGEDPSGHCVASTSDFDVEMTSNTATVGCNADGAAAGCYFHRGHTFNMDTSFSLFNGLATPGVVGAFGTGADPIIAGSTSDTVSFNELWTLFGLRFNVTSGDAFGAFPVDTGNITIYETTVRDTTQCVTTSTGGGTIIPDLLAIVGFDCQLAAVAAGASSHVFLRHNKVVFQGNTIDGQSQGEFNFRTVGMSYGTLQNNIFTNPGNSLLGGVGDRNPIQIRTWAQAATVDAPTGTGPSPTPNRYNVISDNTLNWHGGSAFQGIRACQNNTCGANAANPTGYGDGTPQDMTDLLIERNFLRLNGNNPAGYIAAIADIQGGLVTIRNNVVDGQGNGAPAGVTMRFVRHVASYADCVSCNGNKVRTFGNTYYYDEDLAPTVGFNMCLTATGTIDHLCSMNLVYRPGDIGQNQSEGTGGTYVAQPAGNVFATVQPFALSPPDRGLTTAESFALSSASQGRNVTATPGAAFLTDYENLLRPDATLYDSGAFEYGAASPAQTGLNLETLALSRWLLFNNVMHTAELQVVTTWPYSVWQARNASTGALVTSVVIPRDANGYPNVTMPYDPDGAGAEPSVYARAELLVGNAYAPAGEYELTFTGTGTVRVGGDAVTEDCTGTNPTCSVTVAPTGGSAGVTLNILSSSVAITSISLKVPAAYRVGIWYLPTIEQLRGVEAIRSMNATWVNHYPCSDGVTAATSASCVHTWAARQPAAAIQSLRAGLAWEHLFALCNAIDADCWVTVPHAAENAYWNGLGDLADSTLAAGHKLILEYSNEAAWGGFNQQAYLLATANLRSYTGTDAEKTQKAYVANLANGTDRVKAEFADPTRVYVVLGSQFADTTVTTNELAYWASGTYNPTSEVLNAVAIAPYFGLTTWDRYDTCVGGGCPSAATVIADAITDLPGEIAAYLPAQHTLIAAANLDMIAYEGGSLIAQGGSTVTNATLSDIVNDAVFLADAETLIDNYYALWDAGGGKLFSHFGWVHAESEFGQVLIPEATDAPKTPMWDALQTRIYTNRHG